MNQIKLSLALCVVALFVAPQSFSQVAIDTPAGDISNRVANTRFVATAVANSQGGAATNIAAAPYNGNCASGTSMAAALDAAVAAGAKDIFFPPNCTIVPDSNTLPADVSITGGNIETSIISSDDPANHDVSFGPRSAAKNITLKGLHCTASVNPTNTAKGCPLLFGWNNEDASHIFGNWVGTGFLVYAGGVTYNGVTSTDYQGFATVCGLGTPTQLGDCGYFNNAGGGNGINALATGAGANAIKISNQLVSDGGSISNQSIGLRIDGYTSVAGSFEVQTSRFTNDTVAPLLTCRKSRSTSSSAFSAVITGDALCDIGAYGDTGTQFLEVGDLRFVSLGTVTTSKIPSFAQLRVMSSTGTLENGLKVDGQNSVVQVGASAVTISDFSGNLQSANGVTCSGTPTAQFATVNGIVTHC